MDSPSHNSPLLAQIAQTNLALYRQMHAAGYDKTSLLKIRDAYEFAIRLFGTRVRASGKPFLAHLAGTASILAALGAAPPVIAAGLLHAAYEQGEWGWTRWRDRRGRLQAAIGAEAEELIWRYQELDWSITGVWNLHADFDNLNATDLLVVLIRLANELEDHLDLSMRQVHPDKDAYRGLREAFSEMAVKLRQPALAVALRKVYLETDEADWAAKLSMKRKGSYEIGTSAGARIAKKAYSRLRKLIKR